MGVTAVEPEAILVDHAILFLVHRQRLGSGQEVVPGPAFARVFEAGGIKGVLVVEENRLYEGEGEGVHVARCSCRGSRRRRR